MRVLANAMLTNPETRQIFVDLGYDAKVCNKLGNDNRDDEFLATRIVFFASHRTTMDLVSAIDNHHLAEYVIRNIQRHAETVTMAEENKAPVDPMRNMALMQTAQLLFQTTSFCPERKSAFAPALKPLATLVRKFNIPTSNPLDPPYGPIITALMGLDLDSDEAKAAIFPEDQPNAIAERLIHVLSLSMKAYRDSQLETTVVPLAQLLYQIHEIAPETVRQRMREKLLPTEEDRKQVLGKSDTLPSKLLGSTTNPITPNFAYLVSQLLFDMSDKDATKFVDNVGFGFASGFLVRNNIPVPPNIAGDAGNPRTGSGQRPINPITGQYIDTEAVPDLPEMTDEEKEREAERLFVLFER